MNKTASCQLFAVEVGIIKGENGTSDVQHAGWTGLARLIFVDFSASFALRKIFLNFYCPQLRDTKSEILLLVWIFFSLLLIWIEFFCLYGFNFSD
jgi:hypothetical protein